MRDVVLILGPTAAGKTDLGVQIAQRFAVSLISVDSAMVYRGLDIGTGKPDRATLARHPHALIDILDPSAAYSAGQFRTDAVHHIESALAARRVPVLVGGTMLYFRALTEGLADLPPAHPAIRADIDAQAARLGWPALHAQLAIVDPTAAGRIQINDGQRIQRALEVYRVSGRTLTELHLAARGRTLPYRFHRFIWSLADRGELYARIERRFTHMMSSGLLAEVTALFRRGDLDAHLPAIRSVGYRQLWEHLRGDYPLEEGVRRAILATRHLARRQLIWLRGLDDVTWLDALSSRSADHIYKCIDGADVTNGQ